jgi:HPt (histidine-containing phosphotransfer) domain-containing protein
MQAHLTKPLVFADLARALQRWLPTRITESVRHNPEEAETPDLRTAALETVPMESAVEPGYSNRSLPETAPAASPDVRSPELIQRWLVRREEAIVAVQEALDSGALGTDSDRAEDRERLASMVHKLAGTAAMFGEAALGDQAAALERALRMDLDEQAQRELASDLLKLAREQAEAVEGAI